MSSVMTPDISESDLSVGLLTGELHEIDGTLQRINYQKHEFTVVAQCRIWHFTADEDCQCFFDGQRTMLRCFHPLDQIRVVFQDGVEKLQAKAIVGWEKPTNAVIRI